MKKSRVWSLVNILALLVTLVINGLANVLPLNGQGTGEISDRFKVFFVPAGYVFSIWGIIYLALLVFVVYQALPAQRNNARLQRIGPWFAVSCLANSVWIFMWHYNLFPLSLLVMLVLLASLITIYLRLGIGRLVVSNAEKWLVNVPFSIYLGWITVATVANATSLLDYLKWGGWGISPQAWAVVMLLIATALSVAMSVTRRDIAYTGVLVWAFVGIAVKQAATPLVTITAWAMVAVMLIALLITRLRR
ncbi:MAG: tryptophan-rich sensory protein [Chloroflexi bacterium]|nr:tryptophan-rich sensory protein [Chloroflexota bacterium]